jgi:aldose 1-epimerase
LVALELRDKSGATTDVVLGFDSLEPYHENPPYFGALIGRFGNRINRGKLVIDGVTYQLDVNAPPNHLHGGTAGFHRALWSATAEQTPRGPALDLSYTSPAGEAGYPGTLTARVRYTLGEDDSLVILYEAETNSATVVNLTHHSYFNLAGQAGVEGHQLRIAADYYVPTTQDQLPLGTLEPVQGTPFDFRHSTAIGQRIGADHPQLLVGMGYDHTFAINGWDGSLRAVAEVLEPKSGRRMSVKTTQPGLQLYTGNQLSGIRGKHGRPYFARAGLCLEAQHFPDSPNHPGFPTTLLRPGETYRHTTEYAFHAMS